MAPVKGTLTRQEGAARFRDHRPLVVHQELDVQELGQLRCALLKDVLAVDLAIPRAPDT